VRATAYAVSLAETFGALLLVTYVTPVCSDDPLSRTRSEEFFRERLQELISGQAPYFGRVEYHIEFGTPSDGILEAASRENADFIVMGVRGAGSVHRAIHRLGTTADEVVGAACCPVLTVRRLG
jgi:nucleotide-binding universal stress UspA family protein